MESDQIPEDLEPQKVFYLESQSLYELVLQRFENTLYSFEDGFPAAFDSLSEDILHLLNKLREFVTKCFQRWMSGRSNQTVQYAGKIFFSQIILESKGTRNCQNRPNSFSRWMTPSRGHSESRLESGCSRKKSPKRGTAAEWKKSSFETNVSSAKSAGLNSRTRNWETVVNWQCGGGLAP